MTLSREQWLLLALMAAGWLYYSNQSTAPLPAPVTGGNGGSTVSTDNTTAPNYGLPGWQDLGSKFFTGE
ncbi:hypothetical protein C8E02_0915 [Vogesella indigofera]|uniref:Uncharacterized protein n=1 Tax=Vogesella indigofera TaxID=45465 RepID=A0A495BJ52_VOGIN|nr:hypothetical protein [Vogesella indigofera]RKQ61148.1 hypothetical protein C8E02_0915 [Vogesella indigofera]